MKKILSVLLILIIFMFPVISNANFDFTYAGNEYSLPDVEHSEYIVIFKTYASGNSNMFWFLSSSKINFIYHDTSNNMYSFNAEENSHLYHYIINASKGTVTTVFSDLNNESYGPFGSSNSFYIVYSNFDVLNQDGDINFESSLKAKFGLYTEPSENTTNVPINLYSRFNFPVDYYSDMLDMYFPQYSLIIHDPNKNEDFNAGWETVYTEDGVEYIRFFSQIYANGEYTYSFIDRETDVIVYEGSIVIDNIVYTQDTVNNYINGVFDPTPFLSYEYVSDTEIIVTTQKFFIHEIVDLQCFYAKDVTDISSADWKKVEARVLKDSLTGEDVYQFYFSIKNDDLNR